LAQVIIIIKVGFYQGFGVNGCRLIKKEAVAEYTPVPPNIYCEILFAEAVKVFIVLSDK
jgi:hypothetical protein